jgi:hypothetical protein
MKKQNELPERLLIAEDQELSKYSNEVLNQIFDEIRNLREAFNEAGVPFSKDAFLKTMSEGSTWMTDYLYEKLIAGLLRDGFTEAAIENLEGDKRLRLEKTIEPIAPIIEGIQTLCNEIDLKASTISFKGNEPVTNETLTRYLEERTKHYAIGKDEIELYHQVEEFIVNANKLEASLAKFGFPFLFTKFTSFEYPVRNADVEQAFYPLAVASYDELETEGHATLKVNPAFLEDYKLLKSSAENRRNDMVANPNYSSNTGKASIHLPKDAGKRIEDFIANPESKLPPKGRWKAMGVD